jgi:hypothetical protein
MKVELLDLKKLVPYARNPRITAHAVDKVAASIKEFGFRQPMEHEGITRAILYRLHEREHQAKPGA